MSELCSYQFEDIVRNEFLWSDDYMEMHSISQQPDVHKISHNSLRKHRLEETNDGRHGDVFAAEGIGHEEDENGSLSLRKRRNIIVERRDSFTHQQSDVSPSSADGNSIKRESTLSSENFASSSHAFERDSSGKDDHEFCASGSILDEDTDAVDNNALNYSLDNIAGPLDHLEFFKNAEDKVSSDFLYYGFPEIENFEDVDMMFRSCDSTFGIGACTEDDLDWYSTLCNMGGPGELVKSGLKHPLSESKIVDYIIDNNDTSKCYTTSCSPSGSIPISDRGRSCVSEKSGSFISFTNEPVMKGSIDGIPKEQINEKREESKERKQSTRKRNDQEVKKDGLKCVNSLPSGVIRQPEEATSCQTFSSCLSQRLEDPSGPSLRRYLESSLSFPRSDKIRLMDASVMKSSEVFGNNVQRPPSPNDLSLASSDLQDSNLSRGEAARRAKGDHGLNGKQMPNSGSNSEKCNADFCELGSSNTQEKLIMPPFVKDAASFHQLQTVMEKLDAWTKLRIRDSLYRLARSAEQRHILAKQNSHLGDDSSAPFLSENGFIDMETDTNPIDRSVAHLLFHRPSESTLAGPVAGGKLASIAERMVNGLMKQETTASESK